MFPTVALFSDGSYTSLPANSTAIITSSVFTGVYCTVTWPFSSIVAVVSLRGTPFCVIVTITSVPFGRGSSSLVTVIVALVSSWAVTGLTGSISIVVSFLSTSTVSEPVLALNWSVSSNVTSTVMSFEFSGVNGIVITPSSVISTSPVYNGSSTPSWVMVTFTFSPTGTISSSVAMLISTLVGTWAVTSSSGSISIMTSNFSTSNSPVIGSSELGL